MTHYPPYHNWKLILLQACHLGICGFVMFGWLLPHPILIYHGGFCLLVLLGWQLCQDQCWLTVLTHRYCYPPNAQAPPPPSFIKEMITVLHHRGWMPLPSDKLLKRLIYSVTITSLALSVIRLISLN